MAHCKSYSDLMIEAFQQGVSTWKLRIFVYSMALACFFLGVLSATVSILLWAALPLLNDQNSWVLVMLPLLLTATSFLLYYLAKSIKTEPLFNDVQEQLNLDFLAISKATVQ